MSYVKFLENLGFDNDPFAKTNADEEERLADYFIPPPFFSAVLGDPTTPKSTIVFAPRGNGKTALKRKIEIESLDSDFLCITYNTFNIIGKKLHNIDQQYHLNNIIRLILIAIITAVQGGKLSNLSKDERHIIYLFSKKYLSEIEQTDLKIGIASIKNFNDKSKELWNKFTGPIGLVLNSLFERMGFGTTEIAKFETTGGKLGTQIDQLTVLQRIAERLGFKSIYILIDRVDENALTHGAKNSYKFISTLIGDLQILESKGYAFKFFLWHLLLEDYIKIARPDRVKYYELGWDAEQLCDMLSQRLKAYSNNRNTTLGELQELENFDLDKYISYLAEGSPRNLIRICKEILDQQSEINDKSNRISVDAIAKGFDKIAFDISSERYQKNIINDLRKTNKCNFTIRYIYSHIFKFSQQAGLNKIKSWEDSGAVKFIGTIQETKGAKTSKQYAIADFLLAKTVFPNLDVFSFAQRKIRICSCNNLLLRDWDSVPEQVCEKCQR